MTPVSHRKPCAGNPHARFEEGASALGESEAECSTPPDFARDKYSGRDKREAPVVATSATLPVATSAKRLVRPTSAKRPVVYLSYLPLCAALAQGGGINLT